MQMQNHNQMTDNYENKRNNWLLGYIWEQDYCLHNYGKNILQHLTAKSL